MDDPNIPSSMLPVLLDAAARSPINQPLLHRPLINQLLDNAMLSTSGPRAIGKTRTTTALMILSIERDMKI